MQHIGSSPMIAIGSETTASTSDFLLALAQGLSGLLGITSAVLIFVVDRAVRRYRVHDRAYTLHLGILVVVSAFTTLLAALTWWTWDSTAPDTSLLFCWSAGAWLAILFGGLVGAASISFVWGLIALGRTLAADRADDWEP
jgi:hypothetical protein